MSNDTNQPFKSMQEITELKTLMHGERGLIATVGKMEEAIDELKKFKHMIIGLTLAINFVTPLIWHYALK